VTVSGASLYSSFRRIVLKDSNEILSFIEGVELSEFVRSKTDVSHCFYLRDGTPHCRSAHEELVVT
jgi:hypothetical protein